MSGSYASRLKFYPNKGKCGLPETFDSTRTLNNKLNKLHDLVKNSKTIVVLTGAGISTAAGIPDFRGPNGTWTQEMKEQKQRKSSRQEQKCNPKKRKLHHDDVIDNKFGSKYSDNEIKLEFDRKSSIIGGSDSRLKEGNELGSKENVEIESKFISAKPTLTHRAIISLLERNVINHCITQNVDGLHRKSGIPREKLNVLHGCIFTEKCEDCDTEYFRDFEIGGISFQKTGRKCIRKFKNERQCNGDLRDTLLDWDDDLPEKDWLEACHKCENADLVIALGTSLRIEPAGSLPESAKQFVIVNLQETPKDHKRNCALIIRARVDYVMSDLMSRLGIWKDANCNITDR